MLLRIATWQTRICPLGIAGGPAAAAAEQRYTVPEGLGNGLPNLATEDVASGAFDVLLKCHGVADADIPLADVPTFMVMRRILALKNGATKQRRADTRGLCERGGGAIGLGLRVPRQQGLPLVRYGPH